MLIIFPRFEGISDDQKFGRIFHPSFLQDYQKRKKSFRINVFGEMVKETQYFRKILVKWFVAMIIETQ